MKEFKNAPGILRASSHEVYLIKLLTTKSHKPSDPLFQDLRVLIIEARQDVARQVNSALVLLYWRVGKRIRQDILKESRAEHGEEIVLTLSAQLVHEFGIGFAGKNLRRMVQFAEAFPEEQIVVTLSRQLSWSTFEDVTPGLAKQCPSDIF